MNEHLEIIAGAINRLETRRNSFMSSCMELMRGPGGEYGEWVAMLMADDLPRAVVGSGDTPSEAIEDLARDVKGIDWRKVRR